jgi:Transglutaminase-like superfamily/Coenzyme PQQ synthesis protein D (PqqD)
MALTPVPRIGEPPVLTIPDHIHTSRAPHGGIVLLDARTGQWYAMNATAAALWQQWQSTGDFTTAVHAIAARFPSAGPERLQRDAQQLAATLLDRGLVQTSNPTHNPKPVRALPPPPPGSARTSCLPSPGPRKTSAAAALGLLAALVLKHSPFSLAPRAIGALRHRTARRPATMDQAQAVLAAVHRHGRLHPARAACLEHSLATVIALALTGLSADWCLGYANDPYRFHAWVETEGAAVTHPDDPAVAPFQRILSV